MISKKEEKRIVEAIGKAEMCTSGEIKVHIQRKLKGDIFEEAVKVFKKLGMANTKLKNGVLIFIALKNRQFTIIGDEGINNKVSDGFWDDTVNVMTEYFKNNELVSGIEKGIEVAGNALKEFFPHEADDKDEISNEVSIDDE